jgi:DNA-binding response OmpR family regulator
MTRIAVVNNDTIFLEMMAAVLAEKGWDTEIYRETTGAHDDLKRTRPDLIILDIRMETPEAGWTLLELLTLDRETATIPVIVCSAAIFDLRTHEGWLNEHGIEVLPKPFDIGDLYEKVEEVLRAGHRSS